MPSFRVIRADRGSAVVQTESRPERVEARREPVAVGDWVEIADGAVTAIAPRHSAIRRADPGEETVAQVLAANVDVVFAVHALNQPPNLRRLERLLVMGSGSGAAPVVVLTKADLCADLPGAMRAVGSVAIDVDVVVTSAMTRLGIEAVAAALRPDRTGVFLGPSGAGKSSLVNCLLGEEVMATAGIRDDGRGRHTTTHRQLFEVPGGGSVIDTPGLRGLLLWDADEGMERAFPDVEVWLGQCRFNDCAHETEPGCAVRAAIQRGELEPRRFESWRNLHHELARLAEAQAGRAKAEAVRQTKVMQKQRRRRADRPPR